MSAATGPADYDLGNWLTLGFGKVLVDDDGIYVLDATTGMLDKTIGVDWWGQTAADETRFYVVTSTHGDGPGAFVGAWDPAAGLLWKANQQGGCDPALGDSNDALAVDGGVVYFAPRYVVTPNGGGTPQPATAMFASGLYAFDAATGAPKWTVPLTPRSSISVDAANVYLVEDGPALVAHKRSDGTVAWKTALTADAINVGSQPPVLAGGRLIIAAGDQVLSFDATTGTAAWSAASCARRFLRTPARSSTSSRARLQTSRSARRCRRPSPQRPPATRSSSRAATRSTSCRSPPASSRFRSPSRTRSIRSSSATECRPYKLRLPRKG